MKPKYPSLRWLTSEVGQEEIAIAALSLVVMAAAMIALALVRSEAQPLDSGLANILFFYGKFVIVLGVWAVALLVRYKPASPVAFLLKGEEIRSRIPRVFAALVPVTALALFMPVFMAVKSAIPLFNTYSWDATFIAWDIALHGDDPWRVLQPILGRPWITSWLSYSYHLWFMLIYFGPTVVALFVSDRELRLRFFLGYLLTWTLVGMVCAIMFACVGPVFLEPIVGDDHFVAQTAYLKAAGEQETVLVLEIQRILLESYQNAQYGLGRGITAMPSMHVALCMLYFLAMRRVDRRLGWLFLAFMIVIMIGSVHLAYHYAVDGYVSVVLVGAIWLATKPLARLILDQSAAGATVQRPPAAIA